MAEDKQNGAMPAGHMERYHPNGIKEGDTCKYLEGGIASKEIKLANPKLQKPTYADHLEGVSPEEAAAWLRTKLNIRCFHCKDESDFKYLRIYESFGKRNFLDKGTPVSKTVFDRDVKAFYAVCKDLTTRYPNIPLDIEWFLPWNFNIPTGGKSTLDWREGVSYITIGDTDAFPFQPSRYAHNDDRYIYDIIRHEIGHSLSTGMNSLIADEIFQKTSKGKGANEALINSLVKNISEWASYPWVAVARNIKMNHEGELSKFKEEAYAELFSAYTCPWFKGEFPKEISAIPRLFCGEIKGIQFNGREMVMDSRERIIHDMADTYGSRPFWLTALDAFFVPTEGVWVPCAELKAKESGKPIVIPKGTPNSPYATWDYIKGGWVEFKTREEKCRYLEKIYGRTDEEIEALIKDKERFDLRYPENKMP